MKICTLASGSSGNSLFVESEKAKILIDAGISIKQITLRLKTLGVDMRHLDAVVITHEHTDHASALPFIEAPVYVAEATINVWKDKVKNLIGFDTSSPFSIKDVSISPFSVPHDALDPVGFTIQTDHKKAGIVTDTGTVTALVRERLKGSDVLVLEFNHDERMLLYGSYPWDLKQRIKSSLGHLSNEQASELLESLVHGGLRHVVLAHLSEVNNRPALALDAASSVLVKNGAEKEINLQIAPRKTIGEVIRI